MKVCHIGVISFEDKGSKRVAKAVGGIQGYILDLINFALSNDIPIGFIGKVFNYGEKKNFTYFEIQKEISSTNNFLISLFLSSFKIKLQENTIIHAHRPDHLAVFTFFKRNVSLISLHGQQSKTVNDRKSFLIRNIYNYLENIALKKSNKIIAVDERTKAYYVERFPQYKDKMLVISTGVNTELFRPMGKSEVRKKFNFKIDDRIIVYVGRIEPPKKIADILKAFKILVDQDELYKLIFIGSGVQIDEMKVLSKKLRIDQNVRFLGVRKRNELPAYFSMADCSVLYSQNEGSPLSVKESLACGTPVIANCVGDIPTIVKTGYNGFLVEEETIENLALSMKLAIKESVNLKQNCIDSIQDYTTEKVNKEMINLYESLLYTIN